VRRSSKFPLLKEEPDDLFLQRIAEADRMAEMAQTLLFL
jgi:hypothetical protein